MLQLRDKNWSCPRKQDTRLEMIGLYRRYYGSLALPEEQQFWSLCGQCTTNAGDRLLGSEVDHIINSGLITPDQYHGVELNKDIYDANVKAWPEINWHHGDIYTVLARASNYDWFNPGIVNLDFTKTPEVIGVEVARCLALLAHCTDDVIVFINMTMKDGWHPDIDRNGEDVVGAFQGIPQFKKAMRVGKWKFHKEHLRYHGAGKSAKARMGIFIAIRRPHNKEL